MSSVKKYVRCRARISLGKYHETYCMRPAGHKGECCIEPHAEDIHMSKNGNVVIAAEPEVKDAK